MVAGVVCFVAAGVIGWMRLAKRPLEEPLRSDYPDARSYDMARARYFRGRLAPLMVATLVFVGISFIIAG